MAASGFLRAKLLARLNDVRTMNASSGRPKSARPSAAGTGGAMATGCGTTRTRPGAKPSIEAAVKRDGTQISCTKRAPVRQAGGMVGSSQAQYPMIRRPSNAPLGSRRKASGSMGALTCTTSGAPGGGKVIGSGARSPGRGVPASINQLGTPRLTNPACMSRAPSPSPEARRHSPQIARPALAGGATRSGRGAR